MRRQLFELSAWALAILLVAGTAIRMAGTGQASVPRPNTAETTGVPASHGFDARSLSRSLPDAAATIAESAPFRLDRRPASVPYGHEPVERDLQQPTPPPSPTLFLSGIIGGPPWEAIVEGLPGGEGGVLVYAGQTLGDLRVVSIQPDTVVVAGPDTTWVLTLRRPWH